MKARQKACSVQCVFPGTHALFVPQPSAGASGSHPSAHLGRIPAGGAGDTPCGAHAGVHLSTLSLCAGKGPGCTAQGSQGLHAWEHNGNFQKATQFLK